MMLELLTALLIQLTSECPVHDTYRSKLNRVIDGDTFVLDVDLGLDVQRRITTRLLGIDTPEMRGSQKERGEVAKTATTSYLVSMQMKTGYVTFCATGKTGKYGRTLVNMPGLVAMLDSLDLRKRKTKWKL